MNRTRIVILLTGGALIAAAAGVAIAKMNQTAQPALPTPTAVLTPTLGPPPSFNCPVHLIAYSPVDLVSQFYTDILLASTQASSFGAAKLYQHAWCLGSATWQATHVYAVWLPTVSGVEPDVNTASNVPGQPPGRASVYVQLSVSSATQQVPRTVFLTWHLILENGRWALAWKQIGGIAPSPTPVPPTPPAFTATPMPTVPSGVSPTPTVPNGQVTVASIVSKMTLQQKVAQMFMGSFGSPSGGTTVTPAMASFLKQYQPGGVTLFSNNIGATPSSVTALTTQLQADSSVPLLISIDQEGGQVARLQFPGYVLPSEATYGENNDPTTVYNDAFRLGGLMKDMGINMNLAPDVDVATNPNSSIAAVQRSYGPDPAIVSSLGTQAINGYQDAGIAATAKHFLGLGTTVTNPESETPTVTLTPSQLKAQLQPFQAAVTAGVDSIMVTHVILPGITDASTPASLSYKAVTKVVRDQLKFPGVIMTDSLTMGGIGNYTATEAAVSAIKAGEDIVLVAGGGEDATAAIESDINTIVTMVDNGQISAKRIDSSVNRIVALKIKLGLFGKPR